jgi:predicted RNA-binding Zn ribbon-like protein
MKIAEDEMHAAPSAAVSIGRPAPRAAELSLAVMTVWPYGTDMSTTLKGRDDRSQSHFDADQLEAMTGFAELINTGRAADGDGLRTLADLQAMADRYAFAGVRAKPGDLARAREYRTRLDSIVSACEAGRESEATEQINALLSETGASPQIVAHDGRGPHLHVSRPTSPLADRMAAHFAMGLAWLVVAGDAGRIRSCESPTCRDVFVDFSRNRSRRYCDSRTCGNRIHVAAYRARKHAPEAGSPRPRVPEVASRSAR